MHAYEGDSLNTYDLADIWYVQHKRHLSNLFQCQKLMWTKTKDINQTETIK